MIPQTAPPPRRFDTGTAESMKTFGIPEIALHLGDALRFENNDIYLITELIYLSPTGIRPEIDSVTIERKRDGKIGEKKASVIREQIAKGSMSYEERSADKRVNVKITHNGERLIMSKTD